MKKKGVAMVHYFMNPTKMKKKKKRSHELQNVLEHSSLTLEQKTRKGVREKKKRK